MENPHLCAFIGIYRKISHWNMVICRSFFNMPEGIWTRNESISDLGMIIVGQNIWQCLQRMFGHSPQIFEWFRWWFCCTGYGGNAEKHHLSILYTCVWNVMAVDSQAQSPVLFWMVFFTKLVQVYGENWKKKPCVLRVLILRIGFW